ncbi:nicotinate phosphoribosyltransferase [bacterium]|nr:nicotinate phosphoribosyltransferase [bacterium]
MKNFNLYGSSPVLLTDLYELTMAYGYWKTGVETKEAVFSLFFRELPFGGGYCIACGLELLCSVFESFRFGDDDCAYLRTLRGSDGLRMFDDRFIEYLSALRLTCDVDAIPEGTVVFPHEPLVRVSGPLLQCQIVESIVLNIVNFQTLIATKAARICQAAQGESVLEFGLRRAQGFDGALAASRASYIGGCAGTSNVLAGKLFGIPVKGTHAHSWVMSFDDELESFHAYARAMPNNCIFLVDTYDTLDGVRNAVEAGKWLRSHGHSMAGIRLDSGDFVSLSREARKILDSAGFTDAVIVGSNELDEYRISELKKQGARIAVWGVGTRLVTSHDYPALGGVYKLTAVRRPGEPWRYTVKLSEEAAKTTIPGIVQVRRYRSGDCFACDVMYDIGLGIDDRAAVMHRIDDGSACNIPEYGGSEDLLVPVLRNGELVYTIPSIGDIRARAGSQLSWLPDGIRRLSDPDEYPVGLEPELARLKEKLVHKAR